MLIWSKRILSKKRYFDKPVILILAFSIMQILGCKNGLANTITKSNNNDQIKPAAATGLIFDKTTYDFGKIKPNSTNKAVFYLTNKSDRLLIIKNVKSCCGSVVNLDTKELTPGQTGVLTAEYPSGSEAGIFEKTIEVITNEPDNTDHTLTVRGEIIQTLEWKPKSFTISAFKKDSECPGITITSLDNTKFSVKGFSSSNQCLEAKFDPNYLSAQITLKPVIAADKIKQLNSDRGTLNIEINHPNYKTISINFDIIQSLQPTPSLILVFNAKPNEPVIKSIKIQDNQNQAPSDFSKQIESVNFKHGSSVDIVKSTNTEKNVCRLDLRIKPSKAESSELSLKDELLIKMKDGRQLDIPVRIFYKS